MRPARRPLWPTVLFGFSWLFLLVTVWVSQHTNGELIRANWNLLSANAELMQRNQRQADDLKAARDELNRRRTHAEVKK